MFASMAGYDLGCGPGRGRDTADVLKVIQLCVKEKFKDKMLIIKCAVFFFFFFFTFIIHFF